MFLSSIISLYISAIIANFHILGYGQIPAGQLKDAGRVLGASEKPGGNQVALSQPATVRTTNAGQVSIASLPQILVDMEKTAPGRSHDSTAIRTDLVNDPPGPKKVRRDTVTIAAASAVALDAETGKVLYYKNADAPRSIASITKLMTALVMLDKGIDWDKKYKISARDRREGGKIILFSGDELKLKDLFYLSLVGSDNIATMALANSTGLKESEFVDLMNKKAQALGMTHTKFLDPVGLANNVSTAKEVAFLVKAALSHPEIRKATTQTSYTCATSQNKIKTLPSTDQILGNSLPAGAVIEGGKTGYTESAGYCFTARFKKDGHQIFSAVLGDIDKKSRFRSTLSIVDWVYKAYKW